MYMQDIVLVITVPADVLAPSGARASADTVLTTAIDTSSPKHHWLSSNTVLLIKKNSSLIGWQDLADFG